MDKGITQYIKGVPVLSRDDTVRRAAGLIQVSEGSTVLVIDRGQLIGTVNERAIAAFIAGNEDSADVLEENISTLMDPNLVFVNSSVTLRQAAQVFQANNVDMLPVIDNFGSYHGVLYRKDAVAVLTRNLRPPSVAGMATPLGVHLTTGAHTSGAGSLGLFLTGVSLMTLMAAASVLVDWLTKYLSHFTHVNWAAFLASTPLPISLRANLWDLPIYIAIALNTAIMLALLRMSAVAGYHAAEHMTVHAIEAGESLTPDVVRKMPRVHPRCGTNLLAGASLFMMITTKLASSQTAVLVAMVVVIVGWRSVGSWLQQYATTKPPSEKQLKNGIAAGEELLEKYQDQPNLYVTGFQRIWNMGFLQTSAGMIATTGLIGIIQKLLHVTIIPM